MSMALARFFSEPPPTATEIPPALLRAHLWRSLEARLHSSPRSLPRAPEVALEVLRLSCEPTVSARQVARLLQRDPFLAGRLLSRANSAAFNRSGRVIVHLPEAVSRVGVGGVRDLLLACAVEQAVFRGPQRALLRSLWRRALGTAVAAELLARRSGVCAHQAFALGLMRDIGRPLLVRCAEGLTDPDGQPVPFSVAWAVVDDPLSQTAGAILYEAWHMPPSLLTALLRTDDPQQDALLDAAVRIAGGAASELAPSAALLGLTESDLADVLAAFPAALEQMG